MQNFTCNHEMAPLALRPLSHSTARARYGRWSALAEVCTLWVLSIVFQWPRRLMRYIMHYYLYPTQLSCLCISVYRVRQWKRLSGVTGGTAPG